MQSVRVCLPGEVRSHEERALIRARNAVFTFIGLLVSFIALWLVVVVLVVKVLP